MKITLLPASQDNALLLKSVRLAALEDSPAAFGSTFAKELLHSDREWREIAGRWTSSSSACFLAMDKNLPCGIIATALDNFHPARAGVFSMWVAPAHRRLGVGRMLMDAVRAWAHAHDALELRLSVTSNNDAAIRFYSRLGFSMSGLTEPYPNEPALFEYEMLHRMDSV